MNIQTLSQRALRTVQREDLCSFIIGAFPHLSPGDAYAHNWHIEAIAEHLDAVTHGDITRLIINIPPVTSNPFAPASHGPLFCLGSARPHASSPPAMRNPSRSHFRRILGS